MTGQLKVAQLDGLNCDTAALKEQLAARDEAIRQLQAADKLPSSPQPPEAEENAPQPARTGHIEALAAAESKIASLSKVLSFNAKVIARLEGLGSQLRSDIEVRCCTGIPHTDRCLLAEHGKEFWRRK